MRCGKIIPDRALNEMLASVLNKFIEKKLPCEDIYGRVCSSIGEKNTPLWFSDKNRKTVFVFGQDAIELLSHAHTTYDVLLALGFTREYLKFEVCLY